MMSDEIRNLYESLSSCLVLSSLGLLLCIFKLRVYSLSGSVCFRTCRVPLKGLANQYLGRDLFLWCPFDLIMFDSICFLGVLNSSVMLKPFFFGMFLSCFINQSGEFTSAFQSIWNKFWWMVVLSVNGSTSWRNASHHFSTIFCFSKVSDDEQKHLTKYLVGSWAILSLWDHPS